MSDERRRNVPTEHRRLAEENRELRATLDAAGQENRDLRERLRFAVLELFRRKQ